MKRSYRAFAAYFGGVVSVVVVEGTTGIIYDNGFACRSNPCSGTGGSWSTWSATQGATSIPMAYDDNQCAANTLQLAVIGANHVLYGYGISGFVEAGGASSIPPGISSFGTSAIVLVVGTNHLIYSNDFDGSTWSGFGLLPGGGATDVAPSIAEFHC